MAPTRADTGAHPRQSGVRPRRSPAPPMDPTKANIHSDRYRGEITGGAILEIGAYVVWRPCAFFTIRPWGHRIPVRRLIFNIRHAWHY